MWGTIIEKAWTKIKGSVNAYRRSDSHGLRSFVGAPFFEHYPEAGDNIGEWFQLIKNADEANFLMEAETLW